CLEALSSGGAIGRIGRERFCDESVTAETVCRRAREGDAIAREIVDSAARALGIGIANLLQTLDLERVILGSLAVKAGDLFLEPVRYYTREFAWPSIAVDVEIVA